MDKLFEVLDLLIDRLLKDAQKIDNQIWQEVEKKLKKLELEDNQIAKNSSQNNQLVVEIIKKIEDTMFSPSYTSLSKKLLSSFDLITKNNEEIQEAVNKIEFTENLISLINKEKEIAINSVAASLSRSNVNANAIEPIRKILLESTQFGYSTKRATEELRKRIVGLDSEGAIGRYVNQIATDALYEYDGVINQSIYIEYDMNAFKYLGSLVKDSREQCVRWSRKKVLKKEDLKSEIAWAYKNGSGMKPNTTEENFPVVTGGFRCKHRAIPIIV